MEKKVKKNKQKICFFSPASYPFFEVGSKVSHGGAELQMFLLANYLSENSNNNVCFFVGNYGKKPQKKGIEFILTVKNKKTENIFSKIIKATKYFYQLIVEKPDVIFSTTANAFVGINALYAKVFNKKFVYRTAHQIDVNEQFIKANGLSGKIYKYGLTHATKVVTQNNEDKKLLEKHHNINAEVLKNAIVINEEPCVNKDFILWVGRFETWKQPELLLKIATHFPQEKFVMICPYAPNKKEEWNRLYNEAHKIKNIIFHEKIAFNKIQDYFNRAKLFVNTSINEGFPNTFLQAGLAKTPIASLNVNPDKFLLEFDCGVFAKNEFDYMLKQIKDLLTNEENSEIKGKNLFQYLKNNHDIEIVGKKFMKIIENV